MLGHWSQAIAIEIDRSVHRSNSGPQPVRCLPWILGRLAPLDRLDRLDQRWTRWSAMRSRGTWVCIPMGLQGYPMATGSIREFPASFLVGNPMRSRSGQTEPIALAPFREVHLRADLKPEQGLFRCPMQTTLETVHRVPESPRLGSGLELGELAQ